MLSLVEKWRKELSSGSPRWTMQETNLEAPHSIYTLWLLCIKFKVLKRKTAKRWKEAIISINTHVLLVLNIQSRSWCSCRLYLWSWVKFVELWHRKLSDVVTHFFFSFNCLLHQPLMGKNSTSTSFLWAFK